MCRAFHLLIEYEYFLFFSSFLFSSFFFVPAFLLSLDVGVYMATHNPNKHFIENKKVKKEAKNLDGQIFP